MTDSKPQNAAKVARIIEIVKAGGSYADAGRETSMTRSGARLLHIRWNGRAPHRIHPGKGRRGTK